MVIDRRRSLPLHHQVRSYILALIGEGELQAGDMLPTEEELLRRLGVSRNTVRQAMQGLVAEGRLDRIAGKGTFVCASQVHLGLSGLVPLLDEMRRLHLDYTIEVRGSAWAPAPAEVAQALHLTHGEAVLRVERLRRVQGTPIMFSVSSFAPLCGLSDQDDYTQSVYGLLAQRGHPVDKADMDAGAQAAEVEMARLLEVPARTPLLTFVRVSYDQEDRPLLHEVEYACRTDKFNYRVQLRRETAPG